MACWSSCSKQSTRMTWACRNGSLGWIMPSRRSASSTDSLVDTSLSISAFGIGDALAGYLREMCSTRAPFPDPMLNGKGSRP